MSKGRVLLTGATGLLGSNVAAQLLASGYDVTAIVRKESNLKALDGIDCQLVYAKLTDVSELESAFPGSDYVVHCAARTKQLPNKFESFKSVNIDATASLIVLSEKYKIKRFVLISTANCFINGNMKSPGDESGEFAEWLKNSGYAFSKYIAQEMVLNEVIQNDFPAIVVAPTFVIGERDANISSGKLLLQAYNKRWAFYPSGGKSIVEARYAAEAIVNALKKGNIGECYLLAGENLTYREIYSIIIKRSSKKTKLIHIPDWFFSTLSFVLLFFEKGLNISLPLSSANLKLLCLDNYFRNDKAVESLNLKRTDAEIAINKALDWYDAQNYKLK